MNNGVVFLILLRLEVNYEAPQVLVHLCKVARLKSVPGDKCITAIYILCGCEISRMVVERECKCRNCSDCLVFFSITKLTRMAKKTYLRSLEEIIVFRLVQF